MTLLENKGKGNVINRDDWQTPQKLYDQLNDQYLFRLDCCANENTRKTRHYSNDFENYSINGVKKGFKKAWINPPFSKASQMIKHFFNTVESGVGIYRCDNMETKVWQEIILKHADWVFIPKGRINYEGKEGKGSVFCSALFGFNVPAPIGLDGVTLRCK